MVTMMRRYVFVTSIEQRQLEVDNITATVSEYASMIFAGPALEGVYNFIDYGSDKVGYWLKTIDRYGRHVFVVRVA